MPDNGSIFDSVGRDKSDIRLVKKPAPLMPAGSLMTQCNTVCSACARKLTFCQLNLLHGTKKIRKSNEKTTENKLLRRNSLAKKSVESVLKQKESDKSMAGKICDTGTF